MLRIHNQIHICSEVFEKKTDLATPICAAGHRRSLFTLKRGRGVRECSRREQDDHAHYDQKDLHVLFHRTGSISSDKS